MSRSQLFAKSKAVTHGDRNDQKKRFPLRVRVDIRTPTPLPLLDSLKPPPPQSTLHLYPFSPLPTPTDVQQKIGDIQTEANDRNTEGYRNRQREKETHKM